MKLPLPKDTRSLITNPFAKASNLGLLFNKYITAWSDDWSIEEIRNKDKVNLKADFLSKVKKESHYSRQSKDSVESLYKRQLSMIQGLKSSGWHVESFTAKTDNRLIIGLGGTSVIETGMTLHPLYGFPYIPGSGLKGLARAYAEIGAEPKPSYADLREVFGSESKDAPAANNRQGKVFFMDGIPMAFPKLDLDIMNPHYGDYYQEKKDSKGNSIPPADYLNPVPVTFLAVAQEEKFSFAVFSRDKDLAEKAKTWLIGGLTELGAGGKTNVGYGYFKEDTPLQRQSQQSPAKVPEASPMDALLKRVKQCRQPGDKHILQKVFEDAWKIEGLDRKEFLKQVKQLLPDTIKKNDKIKTFLKEKEKESETTVQ